MEHDGLIPYFHQMLPEDFLSAQEVLNWRWVPKDVFLDTETRLGIGDRFRLSPVCPISGIPRHKNDYFVLFYMYTGNMTCEFDKESWNIGANQALLIPPGVEYEIAPCSRGDIGVRLSMQRGLLEEQPGLSDLSAISAYLDYDPERPGQLPCALRFHTALFAKARWYIDEMCCEHFDPDRHTYMMLPSLLSLFLAALDRCTDITHRERASSGRMTVNEVRRYIKTNYATATLRSTAQRFGFSPNYLSYMLKCATGMGFQQIKQMECVAQSARMLEETGLTVTQIAREVGIHNITHFYHLFSQRFGVTPAQYRRKGRGQRGEA